MVTQLDDKDFSSKTGRGNVIVDFYAEWCGPCHLMRPVFEKASKEYKNVSFYKVDVDNNQASASDFGVRSIPTIVFLKNGQEVDRMMGFSHEEELKQRIKRAFQL